MNATRIWVIASGAAVIAILAGGWFLGVQPQIAAAASTADSLTAVDAQNQATQIKIARLAQVAAKSDQLEAQNAVLLKSVPTILKPNTFIRRINELASLDGVTVSSVTFGPAVAYTPPVQSAGDPALSFAKTDPSITSANYSAVPVTIAVQGTADAAQQFAHDLQNDERVFAIDGIQTTTGDGGSILSSFAGYIYVLKR